MLKKIHRLISIIESKLFPMAYAKKGGVEFGEGCRLNGAPDWGSEPWLISVGKHTEISNNCTFITHDGSTWVFRNQEKYKKVIRFGKIQIGDNCFIGAGTTVMPGIKIGNTCIVGACSLVTKNIPNGEVWGGVPAKFISTTTDFAEKCLRETPEYDVENFCKNKKEEVLRMLK